MHHEFALPSDIPGPPPARLIGRSGNMLQFGRDPLGHSGGLFERYGQVVMLAKGAKTNLYSPLEDCPGTVLAYGPEATRAASTEHEIYLKFPLSGPRYRMKDQSQRTALTKSFLDGRRIGEHRNMMHELRLLTMRIATRSLFEEDIGEHSRSIGLLLQEAFNALANLLTGLFPYDLPVLPFHRLFTLIGELDSEMRRIIEQKRKSSRDGDAMLSILLQARDGESGLVLSEDELIGHTNVFFVAGHETISNALTWTLFLLSQHPTIAADLLDELESVLHGTAPTLELLHQNTKIHTREQRHFCACFLTMISTAMQQSSMLPADLLRKKAVGLHQKPDMRHR